MNKFWMTYAAVNSGVLVRHNSYEEAEREAKLHAAKGLDTFVLEAVALMRQPIPPVEVVKLGE